MKTEKWNRKLIYPTEEGL